jgi:hypothetical protein
MGGAHKEGVCQQQLEIGDLALADLARPARIPNFPDKIFNFGQMIIVGI